MIDILLEIPKYPMIIYSALGLLIVAIVVTAYISWDIDSHRESFIIEFIIATKVILSIVFTLIIFIILSKICIDNFLKLVEARHLIDK